MPADPQARRSVSAAPSRVGTVSHPSTAPAEPTTDAPLRAEAEEVLRRLVGRDDARLRDDQWRAIDALVTGRRRALVVQRTGWGKSAVYFVATALLRARGAGPTVLVSPLLALMRNQVASASRAGVRAATLNSANVTEWDEVHARIAAGEVDVLLVSPERLTHPAFRDEVLPRLAADAGLVVVDEAHCISDWGHDFRPDYRRIRTLLSELPPGVPVLATTATANARVTADVAEQLGTPAGGDPAGARSEEVLVLRGPLDRASLDLSVVRLPDTAGQLAWLAQNLPAFDGSGIVYCLTIAAAQQVTEHLRGAGLEVRAYTGQTDPAERELAESDLLENRVKALVATSALGMGFDKPDLAFVVHVGAPSSPITYYQQVGRAGRAAEAVGGRAAAVLLPGREDRAIWEWFASTAFPPEADVHAALRALSEQGTLSTAALETHVSLRRSRLEQMLKVLDVDGAVRRVRGGWEATGRPWTYDGERYARVTRTRQDEQQAMVDYVTTEHCRMAHLRRALDDPDLTGPDALPGAEEWRCGRCDRCSGARADVAPDAEHLSTARARLARAGVEVEARRQWPSGMATLGVDLRGRIPAELQAAPGRAVARLDGVGLGGLLRDLFAAAPGAPGTAPDGLPEDLRRPVLAALDAWQPEDRVEGVVAVRSAGRPGLVDHLAQGVARHLGVPVVGALAPRPDQPAGRHDVNSAHRLASVVRRLELDLSPAAASGLPGRHVLLVDDRTATGWTLTVGAMLLRQAGAASVRPFVLGVG
jgi:ATP-dependent DNA helicase RecQ